MRVTTYVNKSGGVRHRRGGDDGSSRLRRLMHQSAPPWQGTPFPKWGADVTYRTSEPTAPALVSHHVLLDAAMAGPPGVLAP